MKRALIGLVLCAAIAGCTSVTVRPMVKDGVVLTTESGYPIPEIISKSMGQDREISIWFERTADGQLRAHYERKDTDHSVELADKILEAVKYGAAAAAGAAATGGLP